MEMTGTAAKRTADRGTGRLNKNDADQKERNNYLRNKKPIHNCYYSLAGDKPTDGDRNRADDD